MRCKATSSTRPRRRSRGAKLESHGAARCNERGGGARGAKQRHNDAACACACGVVPRRTGGPLATAASSAPCTARRLLLLLARAPGALARALPRQVALGAHALCAGGTRTNVLQQRSMATAGGARRRAPPPWHERLQAQLENLERAAAALQALSEEPDAAATLEVRARATARCAAHAAPALYARQR